MSGQQHTVSISTSFDPLAIPDELKAREQWVNWRPEKRNSENKPTKVPVNPTTGDLASSTDLSTWTDFETACELAQNSNAKLGIGFVFTVSDPYVGIDLDRCRDPNTGAMDDWAQGIIDLLNSYTEISPSGTGVKIICKGTKPGTRSRKGKVEMYEHSRFFTLTGNVLTPRNRS
jgi:primase-polymerase (primpol)-like protein